MILYLRLYWEFFKTGLFAVGGGLATLPFLSRMGEVAGWFTQSQLTDMVAVAESTPGPIGVNMATYVGFTAGGLPGSLIATLGIITPSYLIILAIAAFLKNVQNNHYVAAAFRCLRPASTGLITASGLAVAAAALLPPRGAGLLPMPDAKALLLAALLLVLTRWAPYTKKLHPLVWILFSALAGILFF